MNCLLLNIIFQNMEDSTYFYCEIPGCLNDFYGPCETCCKKCFCKEHLDSHFQIASLTCQGSLDDLNFSQTQSSVIPEESASRLHSAVNVEQQILDRYTTGCWARPAFCQELAPYKKLKKDDAMQMVMKWKCLVCHQHYTINAKTTANIREHLTTQHKDLTAKLKALKDKKNGSTVSGSLVQKHIDKKLKLVHFTQKGLTEWLVKYSVLTDQAFLKVQHPVFVGLLDYCRPDIVLPDRRQLKEAILETYQSKKVDLKEKLKEVAAH